MSRSDHSQRRTLPAGIGRRSARFAAVAGALAAALGTVPDNQAARVNVSGTARILTRNNAAQSAPAISGTLIAFTDRRDGNENIYLWDLDGDVETPLTSGPQDERQPDISGRTIVYADFGAGTGGGDIMAVTPGDAPVPVAAHAGSAQTNPKIDGSLVVWEDSRDGNQEIYAKNLVTGVETRVTFTADEDEFEPSVDGTRVVYARQGASGECQIYLSDLSTGELRRITDAPACFRRPDIDGRYIVFDGDPGDGNQDIHIFDLATGGTTRLVLAGIQRDAHVSGEWLSAEKVAMLPFTNSNVKIYSIPNEYPFEPTIGDANESNDDIDGQRVAYETDERGNLDIAVFEFEVHTENTPPIADAGPDQEVACENATGATATLDGSASSDPDGDPLTFRWNGPFTAGPAILLGPTPPAALPLGRSTVTLSVDDGAETATDAVDVSVRVTVEGLGAREAKAGPPVWLRLRMSCAGVPLGDEVTAPRLVAISRGGAPLDLTGLDLTVGGRPGGGADLAFRHSGSGWSLHLATRALGPGSYTLLVETPDGTRHAMALTLR